MAAFTFKKYIGEYPNDNALKDALETGTLNTPFLALVDGDLNYDSIVYIDMYVDDELECTLQKNPNTNTWTAYSTSVAMDSTIKFRSNGSDLTFIVDGNDYTEWIAETNLSNPTLTLANGEFTLTYTDDGSYDIRLLIDSNPYDFEYNTPETIDVPLNHTIENANYDPVDWYWNGNEALTQSAHLDKEDIPDYGPQKTVYIEEIEAFYDDSDSDATVQVWITGTVEDASSDSGGNEDPYFIDE